MGYLGASSATLATGAQVAFFDRPARQILAEAFLVAIATGVGIAIGERIAKAILGGGR